MKLGFTLVELIVVITIIAILSTVGFVSYSGYLVGARDSNRIAQLVKVGNKLQVYQTNKSLPLPDNSISIYSSGSVIAYQGDIGTDVMETIQYDDGGIDPKDGTFLTYFLSADRKSFQLLTYLEQQANLASNVNLNTFADYEERFPRVYGRELGVLVSGDISSFNTPVHRMSGIADLDVQDVGAMTLKSYVSDNQPLVGTGTTFAALEGLIENKGRGWTMEDNLLVCTPIEGEDNCGTGITPPSTDNNTDTGGVCTIIGGNYTFALLRSDGTINAWGSESLDYGGRDEPSDGGYTEIFPGGTHTFAALKGDGSLVAWGKDDEGGTGFPTDTGYTHVESAYRALAALKSDGSIVAWGNATDGGSGAPTRTGFTKILGNIYSFAALHGDGTVETWGNGYYGGTGGPTDSGYVDIFTYKDINNLSGHGFVALKADGSMTAWGNGAEYDVPTDSGYVQIFGKESSFAAMKSDGSITSWGIRVNNGPTRGGYTKVANTMNSFAALNSDTTIHAWGSWTDGGTTGPTDSGYTDIVSNSRAFAALKSDGSITAWGNSSDGGSGAPTDTGYTKIFQQSRGFVAMKSDGSLTQWGDTNESAPTDTGFINVISNSSESLAVKSDGTFSVWGQGYYDGPISCTE